MNKKGENTMEENKKELSLEDLQKISGGAAQDGEYKCPECDYSTNDYDRNYRPRR